MKIRRKSNERFTVPSELGIKFIQKMKFMIRLLKSAIHVQGNGTFFSAINFLNYFSDSQWQIELFRIN